MIALVLMKPAFGAECGVKPTPFCYVTIPERNALFEQRDILNNGANQDNIFVKVSPGGRHFTSEEMRS